MTKDMERRTAVSSKMRIEGETARKIVGHAAMFNVLSDDLGGFREQILPGAFRESVERDDIRALFNHDPNYVLGRKQAGTLRLSEDEVGLRVEIDPPDTQAGRDLLTMLDRGDLTQMSFGFTVEAGGQSWERRDGNVIRTLSSLRLFDVSPVVFPAYPQTDVAVRALDWWQSTEQRRTLPIPILRRRLSLSASA